MLSVSQKLDAVSILGTMANVSSTHLRQKEGGSEPQLCQKLHLILLIKFYNKKKITVPFLKYKLLKLKLRVFLAGNSVGMATYCVTKIIPTCSPMIGQLFDNMIVASTDKEWK